MVREYLRSYPMEAARHIEAADPLDVARFLGEERPDLSARILRFVQPDSAARIVEAAGPDGVGDLVEALDPALTANVFARLSEDDREQLLGRLAPAVAKEVEGILAFPPGTAGNLMDARVAVFRRDTTVREALERVRGLRDRRVADLVIADEEGRFEGIARLQDVASAEPDQRLAELESPRIVFVHPMTSRDEVVELLNKHRLSSLPVVDLQNRIVGIIRQAGLVEAAQEDALGDLQQMVGGSKEERALSPPLVGVKSRLPWLNINLLTAFLAASVVGLFESTIAQFTALAVLLPVVAGQSGNTGAQALAVTMRGLALREFRVSEARRVLVKELTVGFINGIAIAAVTAIGVYFWSRSTGLALVMLLAMIASMITASAAGTIIPVVLVKLNRDPATASSIILTTVTDVVGFFTFLGLATLLSGMLAGG
jgi:magnesium transporter